MKLKDFVTKEMLKSVGFDFYEEDEVVGLIHARRKEKNGQELYVVINKGHWETNRVIVWNNYLFQEDITPYIQDLIEKGWEE